VVLEKSCEDFFEEVLVFIVVEGFEEVNYIFCDCEFEPPLFIIEAGFDHGDEVFDGIFLADDLA